MELYKIVSDLMIDIEKIKKMNGTEKKELLLQRLELIYPDYNKDMVEIIIECVIFLSYNKNIIKHINKSCGCNF
jgi:hypothetical protein